MSFIEYIGTKVAPKFAKNKKFVSPMDTSKIADNIYCVKDGDVNLFLIETSNGFVAIDSGHKNSKNVVDGLKQLDIDNEKVVAVFLTHIDYDHAGGIDSNNTNVFPNAKIYMSNEESKYLEKIYFRYKFGAIKLDSPIKIETYEKLKNFQKIEIGGVQIQSLLLPGHTLGHTAFLVDESILFVGDCILLSNKGGYCFYDFCNQDTKLNQKSAVDLYKFCKTIKCGKIVTSHTGMTDNIDFAFANLDKKLNIKDKKFDIKNLK